MVNKGPHSRRSSTKFLGHVFESRIKTWQPVLWLISFLCCLATSSLVNIIFVLFVWWNLEVRGITKGLQNTWVAIVERVTDCWNREPNSCKILPSLFTESWSLANCSLAHFYSSSFSLSQFKMQIIFKPSSTYFSHPKSGTIRAMIPAKNISHGSLALPKASLINMKIQTVWVERLLINKAT